MHIPRIVKLVSEFFKEPNKGINPDEAAAVVAAVLSGNTSAKTREILLDVALLSLGIKTTSGVMTALIKRNNTV